MINADIVWMKMIANLPLLAVFTSQVILTDRHNQAFLDHKIIKIKKTNKITWEQSMP